MLRLQLSPSFLNVGPTVYLRLTTVLYLQLIKKGYDEVGRIVCPSNQGHHGQCEAERRTVPAAAEQDFPRPGAHGRMDSASGPSPQ